jgi:hypothetical protein
VFFLFACGKEDNNIDSHFEESTLCFPPLNSEEWERSSRYELGWNTSKLAKLLTYLEPNNTRAFIILKERRIAIEEYFGNNILSATTFNKDTQWY